MGKAKKTNKNIILTLTILIILVTLLAPKILDLTGRYTNTFGTTGDHETYDLSPSQFGNLIESEYSNQIIYDDQPYFILTDEGVKKISLISTPTPHGVVTDSNDIILDNFVADDSSIFGIKKSKNTIYKINKNVLGGTDSYNVESEGYDITRDFTCDHYIYFRTTIQDVEPIIIGTNIFYFVMDSKLYNRQVLEGLNCRYSGVSQAYRPRIEVFDTAGYLGLPKSITPPFFESILFTDEKWWSVGEDDRATQTDPDKAKIAAVGHGDNIIAFANGKLARIDVSDIDALITDITDLTCNELKTNLVIQGDYVYFICDSDLYKANIASTTSTYFKEEIVGIGDVNTKKSFETSDDKLFYGAANGKVVSFDISGTVLNYIDEISLSSMEVALSISAVNDIVYVGTNHGNLYAFDPDTLEQKWVENLDAVTNNPINSIIIPEDNTMLAVSPWDNKLFLFETRLSPPCTVTCEDYERCIDTDDDGYGDACELIECSDNDVNEYYYNGKNPFEAGTTSGFHPEYTVEQTQSDICEIEGGDTTAGIVKEWYCDENNHLKLETITCPSLANCTAGACYSFEGTYPDDYPTDFECTDSDVTTYFDDGKNIYEKGAITGIGPYGYIITREDYCAEDGKLKEFSCGANDNLIIETVECSGNYPVCNNGKCATSTGAQCGDNTIEDTEVCDGTDLDSKDCADFGYTGGTLSCESDCSAFDKTACTGTPACTEEERRSTDSDPDTVEEYCESGSWNTIIAENDDCTEDYQCVDNICGADQECESYDELVQQLCSTNPSSGWTTAQTNLYNSLCGGS